MERRHVRLLGTLIECLTFLDLDGVINHDNKEKLANELENHGGVLCPAYKINDRVVFKCYKIDGRPTVPAKMIEVVGYIREIRFNGNEFFYYVESEEVDSHGETYQAVIKEDCVTRIS